MSAAAASAAGTFHRSRSRVPLEPGRAARLARRPFGLSETPRTMPKFPQGPRSRAHYGYVVLELLKVAALVTLAIVALR